MARSTSLQHVPPAIRPASEASASRCRKEHADHLVELIEAGLCGDFNVVRRVGQLLLDDLAAEDAAPARARLEEIARRRAAPRPAPPQAAFSKASPASTVEQLPWPTDPLFLEPRTSATLNRFVEEASAALRLQAAGLASRLNLILWGPPGTGKTTIAGHLAARLNRPFNVVRLDAVVSSLLGDTARNLRQAFEAARSGDGFLLVDEVDAVAKARGDARDVGELKRVVNTFIQTLDALPAGVAVVAATNHPQLLDPAIWRRFPFQVELGLPSREARECLWQHHLRLEGAAERRSPAASRKAAALAIISEGLSGSDMREIALSARRIALLDDAQLDMASVSEAVLASLGGRLSMPRRLSKADKDGLKESLAGDARLTDTARAVLRGVSQQAQSRARSKARRSLAADA